MRSVLCVWPPVVAMRLRGATEEESEFVIHDLNPGSDALDLLYTHTGDSLVVEQVLSEWSLELGNLRALGGGFVGGTIAETLNAPADPTATFPPPEGEDEKRASPRTVPVGAILSPGESKTVVETIATLLQLRWIFQHPTATVFSLLSSQGGDTSRDFLLLKGVLEHGLTNELEFRIQGSSMTRNEVEDRICLLTKLLFKQLQDIKRRDAVSSLKRKYATLMGV